MGVTEGKSGDMLTMTHSTSQHRSPQESPTHLPDQDLLGISNGVDLYSFDDEECEDDDITEPIAQCTSLSPTLARDNGTEYMMPGVPLHQGGGLHQGVHLLADTAVLAREVGGIDTSRLSHVTASKDIPQGIECVSGDHSEGVNVTLAANGGNAMGSESVESQEANSLVEQYNSIIDERGSSLEDFIVYVRNKTRNGLFDEYQEIKSRPPDGTFDHARQAENLSKNRYTDVLCYDHTRVILQRDDNDMESDYVNANFVDGYKQKNAFISTQGPLPRTFSDTWQMVWEQSVLVIVMTTRTVERHRTKCGQYWPELEGTSLTCGIFRVESESIENYEDFIVTDLRLTNTKTGECRPVCHFQFTSWPDYGTPDSALSMLQFLQCVREKQADMVTNMVPEWVGHELGPPMVVHCSAGIGRTGTFCTLDIAIRKFEDTEKVDVKTTVDCIRAQRAFSIQMPDQYVFCHLAFLEYVLNMGYVEEIDLTGFDEEVLPE